MPHRALLFMTQEKKSVGAIYGGRGMRKDRSGIIMNKKDALHLSLERKKKEMIMFI